MHSSNPVSFIMFVTGVFSWTQIYVGGAIGLSELFVFAIAPFLFMRNYVQLRRDGFTTLFPGVLVNRIIVLITPPILSVYLIHCNSYGYKALGYLEGYFLWCPMELRVLMMAQIAFIVCIVLDVPRRIVVKLVILCSNKCPVGGRYE